ncbi:MAG: hypothetical protein SPJ62_02615 [Inconstantimicrobium porci]|uniref:hypothetical protein n=1 Tax=Inconstantimicrobium porci TaxID=2652291 RepID=UPI002A91244F|nr:hypothetical protein [Inconstantimicrobium porci]MDY5910907.1 hypothetical protein [Inconstantimicrobium porci]
MKLEQLKKVMVKKAMPITEEPIEVTFEGIRYLVDENEDVTAYIVSFAEYKDAFFKFFDESRNYELENLLDQLGAESFAPEEINRYSGKKIKARAYVNEEYINTTFAKQSTVKKSFR